MSYAIRNTLIIATIWAAILFCGIYYIYGVQHKKERLQLIDNMNKRKRLDDLQRLKQDRTALQSEKLRLLELSSGKMGVLASQESPGETYDYLLREMRKNRSSLQVSLDMNREDFYMGVLRRTYTLNGSGAFIDLYQLMWYLECGPLFYDIQSVKIERANRNAQEKRVNTKGNVQFALTLAGFNRNEGPNIATVERSGNVEPIAELVTNREVKTLVPDAAPSPAEIAAPAKMAQENRPVQPVNGEGLPEVDEACSLLAITPNSVLVRDRKGATVRLRAGDRVFQGRVAEIHPTDRRVIFEINQNGNPERFSLTTTIK
jgi:hypothetical protein